MFNVPLEGPRERSYYHSWGVLVGDGFYRFDALNENYRVELHKHRTISFRLEENASTGFTWFARVSDSKVGVSIDHQQVVPTYGGAPMVGVPGCAEISIKGRHHGDALVELIYARPLEWQRGAVPARVIRLYVDVN